MCRSVSSTFIGFLILAFDVCFVSIPSAYSTHHGRLEEESSKQRAEANLLETQRDSILYLHTMVGWIWIPDHLNLS